MAKQDEYAPAEPVTVEHAPTDGAAGLTLAGAMLALLCLAVALLAPESLQSNAAALVNAEVPADGRWFFLAVIVAGGVTAAGIWRAMPFRGSTSARRGAERIVAGTVLLLAAVLLVVLHVDTDWLGWALGGCLIGATGLIGLGASQLKTASGA